MKDQNDSIGQNDQAIHILNDVIINTFVENQRLFGLFFSLNQKLVAINKQEPKPVFQNCLLFFKFDQLFTSYLNSNSVVAYEHLKLTFTDKRDLKTAFKKAIKLHGWELAKNDKLYDYVHTHAWKYVETFIDMMHYINEWNNEQK